MRNNLLACIGAASLLTSCVSDENFNKNREGLFSEMSMLYRTPIVKKVEKVPLEVRNVPRHPADNYANEKDVAPIDRDEASLYPKFGYGFGLGERIRLNDDWRFSIGAGFDLLTHEGAFKEFVPPNRRHDLRERNYTTNPGSDDRGYGAALTYYQIESTCFAPWNNFLFPKAFFGVEKRVSEWTSLELGFKVWPEQLTIETGWDRYDGFKRRTSNTIADYLVGMPTIALKLYQSNQNKSYSNSGLQGGGFQIGMPFLLHKSISRLGKEMEIEYNKPILFFGITFEF